MGLALAPHRYSAALGRGLAILTCFNSKTPVLSLTDLSAKLEMSMSTTYRYTITLVALGYLEHGKSRKFKLGPRVTDLGMSFLNSLGLRTTALPYLEELRAKTRCTASMAMLDKADILYVARVRSYQTGQHQVDLGLRPGSRLPAYCTAMGKTLLAYLPKEEQRKTMKMMKMSKRTSSTITTKTVLRIELERIKERGYAVNDDELESGLHAVAVPVFGGSEKDTLAAISISANRSRISHEEIVLELRRHLLTAARRISAALDSFEDSIV